MTGALPPADLRAVERALACVRAGRAGEAQAALMDVTPANGSHPDVLYVASQILIAQGRADAALRALEGAVAQAPRHPALLEALGSLLSDLGRPGDALAAFARALAENGKSVPLLMHHANAALATGDADAAIASLERAREIAPDDWRVRHNLAGALRQADRAEDALAEIEQVTDPSPETITLQGHLLADTGRVDDAAPCYRRAIAAKPDLLDAQETLARLLPQIGQEAEALSGYEAALARFPENRELRMSAILAARDLKDHARLISWSDAALARFGGDPEFVLARAIGETLAGAQTAAIGTLRQLIADHPDYPGGHNHLAPILIREGDWNAAAHHAMAGARLAPFDQSGWAWLSIAWRLLGDAREDWLADYERLVMTFDVALDPGLADVLTAMHVTRHNPAEQSLRGGTQTRGLLFDRRLPEIQALKASIREGVREALDRLGPDATHPFLGRLAGDIAFAGSWSVRLKSEGFHINHVHPSGWLSSALYVALPPEVGTDEAGALAFGVPDATLGLDLPPRRIVTPTPGRLAIFPSYFWHGTIPFTSDSPRLTVAFDALPVDNRRRPV